MVEITVTEAKERLEDLLQQIQKGKEFCITENGKPMAVLSHPETQSKSSYVDAIKDFFEFQKKHPIGTVEEYKQWKNMGRL